MKIKYLVTTSFAFISFLLLARCGSDDSSSTAPPELASAASFLVADISNNGNATDLNISFSLSTGIAPDELRLFISKESKAADIELESALNLSIDNYLQINVSDVPFDENLSSQFTDTDGDVLEENVDYVAFVLSISNTENIENILIKSGTFDIAETDIVTTLVKDVPVGTGGVSIDADGNIYLSDFGITLQGGGDKIYKVTPDGQTSVFATGLNGAAGSDFDNEGNLYQSNISNNSIAVISPDGTVSSFIASNSTLGSPVGLIYKQISDTEFNIYVTSCGNNTILKIDQDKNITEIASGSNFNCPNGITMDDDNNLYVTNFNNGNIIKISDDTETSLFKTLPGGQNTHPVYHDGEIYVVARGVFGIYRVNLASGVETLIAGNGTKGIRNGQALKAQFSRPNDIDITPDGKTLYINDSPPEANARNQIGPVYLRKISLK